MRDDVSFPNIERPEVPIDPTGRLLRAGAEPSPTRRRSALRQALSNGNAIVIEATLLLGRAIEEGRLAVSADDRDMLIGAARGFMVPSLGRSFMGRHLADQAIKSLQVIIMHRLLEAVDALTHERVQREAVAIVADHSPHGKF